jgi:hypothetical protein
MKKILLVLLFNQHFIINAADSLKVYIVGDFYKGETFKIHTPNKTFHISIKNKYSCSSAGWYFFIPKDSTVKDGSLLPIIIEKKKGRKYYDLDLVFRYQSDRKYFIIWKDNRQSKKYPFIELWSKKPVGSITLGDVFWSETYNSKFIPIIINETKSL